MGTRIAISGFGRIGRLTLRHLLERRNIEVVAINDLADIQNLANLFKYDYGPGGLPRQRQGHSTTPSP